MEEKNGNCGTYLHGWICSDELIRTVDFTPHIKKEEIIEQLKKDKTPFSAMVSKENRNVEDVVKAISDAESINKNAVWLHPLFVGFKTQCTDWIVLAIDEVYRDGTFGIMTIKMVVDRHSLERLIVY